MLSGINIGFLIFLLFGLFVIASVVLSIGKTPTFDQKRRELRHGRRAPIPFRDLEVGVFNIHRRGQEPDAESEIKRGRWGGMAAGALEIHRVYVRAGDRRVDLRDFQSEGEAERYANEIRELISEN
jgi:hypothetical protein